MFRYSPLFLWQNFLMLMWTLGASDPTARQMLGPVLKQLLCYRKFQKVNIVRSVPIQNHRQWFVSLTGSFRQCWGLENRNHLLRLQFWFRLRIWFRIQTVFRTLFQIRTKIRTNCTKSCLFNVRSSLFPRKLISIFFWFFYVFTFLVHFMLDPDPNPIPES